MRAEGALSSDRVGGVFEQLRCKQSCPICSALSPISLPRSSIIWLACAEESPPSEASCSWSSLAGGEAGMEGERGGWGRGVACWGQSLPEVLVGMPDSGSGAGGAPPEGKFDEVAVRDGVFHLHGRRSEVGRDADGGLARRRRLGTSSKWASIVCCLRLRLSMKRSTRLATLSWRGGGPRRPGCPCPADHDAARGKQPPWWPPCGGPQGPGPPRPGQGGPRSRS